MLAPTERAPDSRPSPLPLPSAFLAAELGPVVMADDLCEAAFGSATPTGPRNYYRARYYDPKLGRFLSEDPVDYRNGVSLYAYVLNRPTLLVDPTGMVACDKTCPPVIKQAMRDLCNYAHTIQDAAIRQCIEKKCKDPDNSISCNQNDEDCKGGSPGQTKTSNSMVLCPGNPMPPGACWKRVIMHEMWIHECRPGGPAEPDPVIHEKKREITKKIVTCP